jgi:hypothetical protein
MIGGEPIETLFESKTSLLAIPGAKHFTRAASLPVFVLNADGNVSRLVVLVVENGPLITRVPRRRLKSGRGDGEMELGGVSFQPGITVFAGGASLETSFINETVLKVKIPRSLTQNAGSILLQARNPDGGRSNMVTIKVVE